jgi:hypothetical protein
LAILSFAVIRTSGVLAQVEPCTVLEEENIASPFGAANVYLYRMVQEFKPQRSFTLCAASVKLDCDNTGECDVTLYILDGWQQGSNVLTQASLTTVAWTEQWYYFDFPDYDVTQDTSYYIYVTTVPECHNVCWFRADGNPYPRGVCYVQDEEWLTIDYLFITYAEAPGAPSISYYGLAVLAVLLVSTALMVWRSRRVLANA